MKQLLKTALAKLGYRLQGTRYCPRQLLDPANARAIEFDDVLCRRMYEIGREFTFIQVGAFDGITNDPLRKYITTCGWKGVVIEPQPKAADRLRELYGGNNHLVVLQAAVDSESGRRILYTADAPNAPSWVGGLASFQKDNIIKHSDLIPGLENMIREVSIDCVTFDKVLAFLPTQQIDLLQIDTEGADGYILSLFPLESVRPAIIHWEVKHLSMAQREDCLEYLVRFGYRFAPSGDEDMLAVLDEQRAPRSRVETNAIRHHLHP
jgi:FkbM family methyltransferase